MTSRTAQWEEVRTNLDIEGSSSSAGRPVSVTWEKNKECLSNVTSATLVDVFQPERFSHLSQKHKVTENRNSYSYHNTTRNLTSTEQLIPVKCRKTWKGFPLILGYKVSDVSSYNSYYPCLNESERRVLRYSFCIQILPLIFSER